MSTHTINGVMLVLTQGDIVKVPADAIVNAANSHLGDGTGVNGAIQRAGGPRIMQETDKIGGCSIGNAVATSAGNLPAQYVFHAVGPIYSGTDEDAQLLTSAYKRCLELAEEYQIASISFPSLSTGVYGYPLAEAAPIALRTIIEHIQRPTSLKQVTIVLYGSKSYEAFEQALNTLLENKL